MRHQHRAHIHIMPDIGQALFALVQGQLIAPEIDIAPAAFLAIAERTAEHIGVELQCVAEIASGNGEMQNGGHGSLRN